MIKLLLILRSLLGALLIGFITLLFGIPFIVSLALFGYRFSFRVGIPWAWGKLFCLILGVRLDVKGLENIPSKGVVFLFSHSSYLDIPVLFASIPGVFNFASKDFVLKFPVIGTAMKLCKTILIPDDREKAIEQYKMAEQRLIDGDRFMISPEGGRSTGEEMMPFKSGPFIFAINCNATLVPIVIYGAHRVWPPEDKFANQRIFCGKISVRVLEPVSVEGWDDSNRKERAELIRQDMAKVQDGFKSN